MEDLKRIYQYPLMTLVTDLEIKDKKYNRGYIKELDIVSISNNGYIGDVVEIKDEEGGGALRIGLPKRLKEEEVLLADLPIKEQYWKRQPIPKTKSEKAIERYKAKEIEKRTRGVWISIAGEETFIAPDHYFYIQTFKDEGVTMNFRFADLVFFYFWTAVLYDKRAFGLNVLKARRIGLTAKSISIILNRATIYKNKHFGLTNMTSGDAEWTFRQRLIPAFRAIPSIFKPTLLSKDILTKIVFDEKISRKDEGVEESRGLQTIIDYKSTSENSYDGQKLDILSMDETSKLPVSYIEWHRRIATTLRVGKVIKGKLLAFSTYDDKGKGGDEFKVIWEESKMNNRDVITGQTKSGLYRLFLPSDLVYEGYITHDGFPIIETPVVPILNDQEEMVEEGFDDYFNARVDLLKNDSASLYEFYHQTPRNQAQAFMAVSGESLIDLIKANEQINYISAQEKKPYRNGEFMWRDPNPERTDHTVDFIPTQDGSFRVYWMPPKDLQNNHIIKNGKIYPANDSLIEFATDPYKVSKTTDSRNSNTALVGMMYPNVDDRMPNGFSVAVVYNNRERTVEEMLDKMIRVTLFYSAQNLVESNVDNLIGEFYNRGLTQFVRRRPDKHKLTSEEKRRGGIPNNSERLLQLQALYISDYGTKYIGKDHETGEMKKFCMDKEVITELIKYNPRNRTDSDLGIVMGLVLVSIYARLGKIVKQSHQQKRTVVKEYKFSSRKYSY